MLSALAQQVASRFRGRADTEHVQAFIRLGIASLMATLLLVLSSGGTPQDGLDGRLAVAIAIEAVLAVTIVIWIAIRPSRNDPRRVLGILGDLGASCLAMHTLGVESAPLWGVCLWVVVGNGLRFGPRYLVLTIGVALTFFGATIVSNTSWAALPVLSWTLWGVLLVIPVYLYKLVRDLTAARDAAAQSNAAKTWFLASTSHELRTPLNAVVAAVELLRTTELSAQQQRLADSAVQGARALTGLLGDILDISAIESGALTLHWAPVAPREIGESVVSLLAATAQAKGIELGLEVAAAVPMQVELDAQRTRQALLNLAHNAVKFTDVGSVRVRIAVTEVGDGLLYEVADTGIGIPTHVLPRIFEAFTQAETGAQRRYGGTGIGTTIARELVQRMGGRMYVESRVGAGSRFWFTLPLRRVAAEQTAPATAGANMITQTIDHHRARIAPRRILVLDDLASNREVLRALLERLGHSAVECANAPSALRVLEQSLPDAAIIDWHMPEITGHEFLKELAKHPGAAGRLPVIVLTADATAGTEARARAAGARGFLTKPISVPALVQALEIALGTQPATTTTAKAQPEPVVTHEASADELVLDATTIDELLDTGLSEQTIAALADAALDDVARALNAARESLRRADSAGFADAAHAIKGVASNVGARSLAAAAQRAMDAAPEGFGTAAGEMLAAIEVAAAAARQAIDARFARLRVAA